jgi:poly(3-hydroxybutyrate) depolymerase
MSKGGNVGRELVSQAVCRAGWLALGCLALGSAAAARAQSSPPALTSGARSSSEQTVVFVGAEGLAGTWRVSRDASTPAALCDDPPPACAVAEVLVSDDGVLRLDSLAGTSGTVSLALRLLVAGPEPTTAHVFVGGSGTFSVWLDGRELARGAAAELRPDDVHAELALAPGSHLLTLRSERPPHGPWQLQARLLDASFTPGLGAAVVPSVGALDASVAAALAVRAVRVRESRSASLDDGALVVELALDRPAGGVALSLTATLGGEPVSLSPATSERFVVPAPARGDLREPLVLRAGVSAERSLRVGVALALDRPVAAALRALREVVPRASAASSAPLAWRVDELERILRERDPDALWRRALVADAHSLVAAVERGRDPLAAPTGYVRMALRSRLDGALVPYELFVPSDHARGARRYPLLVTLHGFTGNAGDYFRDTFSLPRGPGVTLEDHGRNGEAPTRGPMIVVAPTGRGQTHYRYAGEEDVLEVLADVRARYRVDDARVYITGGSMGGTGAAYLPFRHPDLFAASAALAGYHDQRVRQDTAQDALAPWERFLRAERSDVDWAENALHLPMLLVRGTRDRPLAWTTSLVERLEALRYRVEHRQPESGHNVWTETYAGGALFRWLAPFTRPASPAHVRFRTARARHAQAWWVRGVQRASAEDFGDVDATLETTSGAHRVRGTTRNVARVVLSPGSAGERVRAELDGDVVEGASPLALSRVAQRWIVATPPAAPELGPIRDVYDDPLLFVVGTADPRHTLINRLVARAWAQPRGWTVSYPIVDDDAVTDEQLRTHTLVLVGPPRSNRVLARVAAQLPLRFDADALVLDGTAHRGEEVGTVFVATNPLAPPSVGSAPRLLVIAGVSPLGTWRSTFLPDLLPDLVVFDERIAAARERFAAGGTGAVFREARFYSLGR